MHQRRGKPPPDALIGLPGYDFDVFGGFPKYQAKDLEKPYWELIGALTVAEGDDPPVLSGKAGVADEFAIPGEATGDTYKDEALVIESFDASQDKIYIPDGLAYGGATSTPAEGTYSVWQKDGHHVVTWKDDDGWNDVIVKGDNPLGSIVGNVVPAKWVQSAPGGQDFEAEAGVADNFVFTSESTGSWATPGEEDQVDHIKYFDASQDKIHLPEGLVYAGSNPYPEEGTFSVNEANFFGNKFHVVTWQDENGRHDIVVHGDNPTGAIIANVVPTKVVQSAPGVQNLVAEAGVADKFVFTSESTGDLYKGQADVIEHFDVSQDAIYIGGEMTYGGATSAPAEGTYSVWQKDGHHVVTWKDDDGWNDVIVKGDNPLDAIIVESFEWLAA